MGPEQIRAERERMEVADPVAFFLAELAAQFAEYNAYQKAHLEFMRAVEEKQLQLCEEESEQQKEAHEAAMDTMGTFARLVPQPAAPVLPSVRRPRRREN